MSIGGSDCVWKLAGLLLVYIKCLLAALSKVPAYCLWPRTSKIVIPLG